jgi:cytochrome oxidase Cu insertion factor (SCO1/SenC/PrrC family)
MDSAELSAHQAKATRSRFRGTASYFFIGLAAALLLISGCKNQVAGRYPITYDSDCLPNITLTDQYNHPISLASLRGKPVLFDFIYTSCPGPCQLLTQHMALIAKQLGPALGTKVWFVSITIDPQHDHPSRLLNYAQAEGANLNGWYLLTGSLPQIQQILARFKLRIQHESDGSIDHVLEYFLVNPNGHPSLQYVQDASPSAIASDAQAAASGNGLFSQLTTDFMRWI